MKRERKLNRLKKYDYSQPGNYYITICVHSELRWKNIFGNIHNGKMELNEYGGIVKYVWQNLPNHYNNCTL
ncbi:MAG: hypothetical protein J7L71_08425, partial [Spirochaetaceae bacterium]|nr:hypothetical protein [Spirochaetaceae bacterium]